MHLPKEDNISPYSFNFDMDDLLLESSNENLFFHKREVCPLCIKVQRESVLGLYEINFNEAVWLCPFPQCTYPLMEKNLESSYLIKRDSSCLTLHGSTRSFSSKKLKKKCSFSQRAFFEEFELDSILADLPNFSVEESIKPKNSVLPNQTDIQGTANYMEEQSGNISPIVDDVKWPNLPEKGAERSELNVANKEQQQADSFPVQDCLSAEKISTVSENKVIDTPSKANCREDFHSMKTEQQTSTTLNMNQDRNNSVEGMKNKLEDILKTTSSKDGSLGLPPCMSDIIQWTNNSNSCWLDVIMVCLVNSTNLRAILNLDHADGECILRKLCEQYDCCQNLHQQLAATHNADESLPVITDQMYSVREELLSCLRNKVSLQPGFFQSPLELFPVVLRSNLSANNCFKVYILWQFKCTNCGHERARRSITHIVSFPSTSSDFHPLNASFERSCFKCQTLGNYMTMAMEKLPPCLIFHFQQGLPHSNFRVLDFGIQGTLYSVFAVIQYILTPIKHFVTWVRNGHTHEWLCCNDLKSPVCKWQKMQPNIPPKEIHMVLWERQSVIDPKNASASAVLTLVNKEVSTIADQIPLEVFYAHEADDEAIVVSDELMHYSMYSNIQLTDMKVKSQASSMSSSISAIDKIEGIHLSTHHKSEVNETSKSQYSEVQQENNMSENAENQRFTECSSPAAEVLENSEISVFPVSNGKQTIQLVTPSAGCNIMIFMSDNKNPPILYTNYEEKSSPAKCSFLNEHPLTKRNRQSIERNGLNIMQEFRSSKIKRQFRLSGYSVGQQKKAKFSPLRVAPSNWKPTGIAKNAKNCNVNFEQQL